MGVVSGSVRSLLAAERVMLNFLQRLSGIATMTACYAEAVRGTKAKICDTRKTTPGWRELEKYAVRCGGGFNHRHGLYDAVLIKDNHLAAWGMERLLENLQQVVEKVQRMRKKVDFIEVEVDNLEELRVVLSVTDVNMILLDNMTTEQIRSAVCLRDELCRDREILLEASGNITLDTIRAVAETGVDRISVGALTHSVRSLDIGFDLKF